MRNLLDSPRPEPIRPVVLHEARGPCTIETSALLDIIEHVRSRAKPRADLSGKLRALSSSLRPLLIRQRDIFLTIGAFWALNGMGLLLQELKNAGVIIGVYLHDILPVTDPEYFDVRDTRIFIKGFVEAITFADFVLTTSEFNKVSLIRHMAARNLKPLPVRVVPLAHELLTSDIESELSSAVAGISNAAYVLCVGTIEVRKNPTYLFNIWKLMVRAGRANIPTLVFAGRKGWLVEDLMEQLKACNYLDGRIAVLHNVTDLELAMLYRKCLLTMFPSWAEGWGLPVGESLAYGKISIASRAGAIPEVGGELVDYIDPYNAGDGFEVLSRYLDDPELRHFREREIVRQFNPRPWRKVADDLLDAAQALARRVQRFEGIAAIRLPPNRYLPISSHAGAIPLHGIDGELSADLICISGWRPPEIWGVRAGEPRTMLRFRADAPAGTRIHLTMRLIAAGSGPSRIRICSGSGADIEVALVGGSERLAVLSCAVEPGDLVSARISTVGAAPREDASEPYWGLKGIIYFQPERIGGGAPERLTDDRSAQPLPKRPVRPPTPQEQPDRPEPPSPQESGLLLRAASLDDSHRAASFGTFLHSADSYWPSGLTIYRDAPIFADHADKQIFYNAHGRNVGAVTEEIKLVRRSDQYVSMSRFSEGSVFDRSGVYRAFGYLQSSPPVSWLSREADGIRISEQALAAAPCYDNSYFIFYNGNLQNYYHWMTEAILSLDILSRSLGPDLNVNVVLPKSMDIAAVFDHRESLRAVGLDGYHIVEAAANLIKVREAIWVDSDLVQSMPAPYLKDFQQRVAARYSGSGGPRNKRLLVARKGPTRMIHNIEEVQAFLSKHDFETIYLEGMTIEDQILLFQNAEFVIGPHGAGLSNLLFCKPGTKVIEFMPSVETRPFFWLISEKLDLVHGVQFCSATKGQGFQAAVIVDVSKLQALYRMVDAHC
jgi:glycosyltransferase involved in cell wall biosynthesis